MMNANEFLAKLKANGSEKDEYDLDKVFAEYKCVLDDLPVKTKATLSLNILCTLCRNLEKVPQWRQTIDNKSLLNLTIDCVRETRGMERPDRVKTLACVYHIQKHVVKQPSAIPPELVLKLSFMPFEIDSKYLLTEYHKTYWNILADRITYIGKLNNVPIGKLLPKLSDHLLKTIEIYDTLHFCSSVLTFLMKKLHFLYTNGFGGELNEVFLKIFQKLSEKDLSGFQKLSESQNFDIYVKLNDCLYVVSENSAKIGFKNCPLEQIVKSCATLLGHVPDFFYCFQTFYLNTFCSILSSNNLAYTQRVLNGFLLSFEATEMLGYKKAFTTMLPYLNNILRLFIESKLVNCHKKLWKDHFDIKTQEISLKIVLVFMKKLKYCKQLLKCDSCSVQTGLHDALRLSFVIKNFITINIQQKLLLTDIQPILLSIINKQYEILNELKALGCFNFEKCFRKNQTDIHNAAISLNKAEYYEYSIKLFSLYLSNEFDVKKSANGLNQDFNKNVSRAFYNKSICELDCQLFKDALIDGFLSLIFSQNEGLQSDKYMSLIMDVKAKELKSKVDEETDEFQVISVVHASKIVLEENVYGEVKEYLMDLPVKDLLVHEFSMYAKLWPSIAPVAGVWMALYDLYGGKHDDWIKDLNKEEILWTLYRIILETASVVRTLHSDLYKNIIKQLLDRFDGTQMTPDLNIIRSSLMFINTEYSLAAASQKYGWKNSETTQTMDPDQIPINRTLPQEHTALKEAYEALEILTDVLKNLDALSKEYLQLSLPIYQIFVYQFLYLSRTIQALQLAFICCELAKKTEDDEFYIKNAGIIMTHCSTPSEEVKSIITVAGQKWMNLNKEDSLETSIIYLCDASIYFYNIGSIRIAARLLHTAQAKILKAYEKNPNIGLDLAVGRVMDSQTLVCRGSSSPTILTVVNGAQRHYLSMNSTAPKYTVRRTFTLQLRHLTSLCSVISCGKAAELRLYSRAMCSAAAALRGTAAGKSAQLFITTVDCYKTDDAQIKIDNRLKHILGLQPSNEIQPYYAPSKKLQTPREIEPMRDCLVLRKTNTSPSVPFISVPAFQVPEFYYHKNCVCYACVLPVCFVISCQTVSLEASTYFRSGEIDIARNYFEGAVDMYVKTDAKLKEMGEKYKKFKGFLVDNVLKRAYKDLRESEVKMLLELSFFELKCKNYDAVDEYLVRIHEITQELNGLNSYLSNDVSNLMITSTRLRNVTKKTATTLETEFENLKINPVEAKTPENKLKEPKAVTKKVVKEEEIFKKRKVIKLNFDEDDNKDFEKPEKTKKTFKIPIPVTNKPTLEEATPKTRPKILLTQPTLDSPSNTTTFFTPSQTPEQYFTPISNVKTYTKRNLRQNIVKNLENEFMTPKEKGKSKDGLKRATSPGKLAKERPRRQKSALNEIKK